MSLNGASPTIASLTLNGSGGTPTLAAGSGGTLYLDNGSQSATIRLIGGSGVVAAPIVANSNIMVAPATGSTLTLVGGVTGAGQSLIVSGPGQVILGGNNGYTGGTVVVAGTLVSESPGSLRIGGAITVGAGAGVIFGNSPVATTTSLQVTWSGSASGQSLVYDEPVSLTVSVSDALAYEGIVGNVTFRDGSLSLGTVAVDASGNASLTVAALPLGSNTITATFVGPTNFVSSTSGSFSVTVNPIVTATVVTGSPNPAVYGQPITFTATVGSAASSTAMLTGTVQFIVDGHNYGAAIPLSNGMAMITYPLLPAGTHQVSAVYTPDNPGESGSQALSWQEVVSPAPLITAVAPPAGPIGGGTAVTISGTGFVGTTAVYFGATPASFTINAAQQIVATSPAGVGIVDISVVSSVGTSAAVPADKFRFVAAPIVTSVSVLASGPFGTKVVDIRGSNLSDPTTVVYFSSAPAAGFSIQSDSEIIATSPPGIGTSNVTVVNAGGSSTSFSAAATVPAAAPTAVAPPAVAAAAIISPATSVAAPGNQARKPDVRGARALDAVFGTGFHKTVPAGVKRRDATPEWLPSLASTSSFSDQDKLRAARISFIDRVLAAYGRELQEGS
jgi:autotransporter-associated beta strand protein